MPLQLLNHGINTKIIKTKSIDQTAVLKPKTLEAWGYQVEDEVLPSRLMCPNPSREKSSDCLSIFIKARRQANRVIKLSPAYIAILTLHGT